MAQKFRMAFSSSAESGSEVASVTWTLRTSGHRSQITNWEGGNRHLHSIRQFADVHATRRTLLRWLPAWHPRRIGLPQTHSWHV